MFESINTAGSGLQSYHTWLDTIANNIANVNDTAATNGTVFTQRYVELQESAGHDGVEVRNVASRAGDTGDLVQDPGNPVADANGYVRRAHVDLSKQMGDMIIAQRAFQANANVVDRAKAVYEAAINIGKGI